MNINVPLKAIDHFWNELPIGSWEFWAFRFPPRCKVGDPIFFRFDGVVIASAIVAKIERPEVCRCESSGKFWHYWKVFWMPETFVDLRGTTSNVFTFHT
jgi:hypothetical protein